MKVSLLAQNILVSELLRVGAVRPRTFTLKSALLRPPEISGHSAAKGLTITGLTA